MKRRPGAIFANRFLRNLCAFQSCSSNSADLFRYVQGQTQDERFRNLDRLVKRWPADEALTKRTIERSFGTLKRCKPIAWDERFATPPMVANDRPRK